MNINMSLLNRGLVEVSYKEFYRNIFPVGSFEERGVMREESIMVLLLSLRMIKKLMVN